MKDKIITVCMYLLLATIAIIVGFYWTILFAFDDVINKYCGGILKIVFLVIIAAGVILPVLKYRKYEKKWLLPAVLIGVLLLTPIFNNGILGFVKDDLRIYSEEKWNKHKDLRTYMIEDLEINYLYNSSDEEYVIGLLGEPDFVSEENPRRFMYYVGNDLIDGIYFYIEFEDGKIADTGRHYM